MVGEVLPKQRRQQTVPPASSKAGGTGRRVAEPNKKKGGAGLADLREEDKAKVARLINHFEFVSHRVGDDTHKQALPYYGRWKVLVGFREIDRLNELVEGERRAHESVVTKLQQQNHEVASEVSPLLRLKLASTQLSSPLPSHKAGRPPSLSPIREAECCEAENEAIRGHTPAGDAEINRILREREINSSDLRAGSRDEDIFSQSEGTERHDENAKRGGCQASYPQADLSNSRGKENKDPELLPRLRGDCVDRRSQQDANVLPKRPPPRPLPNLLTKILHRSKGEGCLPSADCSESWVGCVSRPDGSAASNPVLQGLLKPEVPLSQLVTAPCSSSLDPGKLFTNNAANNSQGLLNPSTGMSGDHLSCAVHGKWSQPQMSNSLPILWQSQAGNPINSDGQTHMVRSETARQDLLSCDCLKLGQQCQTLNNMVHTHCTCSAVPKCDPVCQQSEPLKVTNLSCQEHLGGSEKMRYELCIHEDLKEAQTGLSQKKLRFDPTAGEEGVFYYAGEAEDLGNKPLQSTVAAERVGGQVEGEAGRVSSHVCAEEAQSLKSESHWTPEAIEKRNSFHRIPVDSPRSTRDCEKEGIAPEGVGDENMEKEIGRDASSIEEHELPKSENEEFSEATGKVHRTKLRRSLRRASTCIKCSSIVLCKSRRPQSSKLPAKRLPKCSKCFPVVNHNPAGCRKQENATYRGSTKICQRCSRLVMGKPGQNKFKRCVATSHCSTAEETSVPESLTRSNSDCSTEGKTSVSDSLISSSSQDMARCVKCTNRLKTKLLRPLSQNPRSGQGGMKHGVALDEGRSKLPSLVCHVTNDDGYVSTQSGSENSVDVRKYPPSIPVNVCRIHTRNIRRKHGIGRESSSAELEADHGARQAKEVFHVNHEILDILLRSDGEYARQLRSSLVHPTGCRVQTQRFRKSQRGSYEVSVEGGVKQRSEATTRGFALNGLLDADLHAKRELSLSRRGSERAKHHHHQQGGKQSLEKYRTFEVDDLLDRFMQSNAECAAELIKCSVYFESVSRPSLQKSLVNEEATEGGIASRLPSSDSFVGDNCNKGCIVSRERVQPRREFFLLDDNALSPAEPCPEDPVRCSDCSTILNSQTLRHPVWSDDLVEKKECGLLCGTCFASKTAQKRKDLRRSANYEQEGSRQSRVGAPPIVLPKAKNIENRILDEVEKTKTSVISSISSELPALNSKEPGDWASKKPDHLFDLCIEDCQMPIARVSVSSERSTPPGETEEPKAVEGQAEIFDVSLYDLVNDIEGQRRDYWRSLQSHSTDDGTETRNQDTHRKREVDNVPRAPISRRFLHRKDQPTRQFR